MYGQEFRNVTQQQQGSSIYPQLYVTDPVAFPQQEYFTTGFVQQESLDQFERPEEYVPRVVNMENSGFTDDIEQNMISITGGEYQQPSSSSQNQVFLKPHSRQHAGKRMPVSAKKISKNDRPPVTTSDDEQSDKGEEVQSPVAPSEVGIRKKRLSSTHSSSSSTERSPSPKRKKSKRRHSRSRERSVSRPSCRSPTVSPVRPRESPHKPRNKAGGTGRRESTPAEETATRPTRPQHPPRRPPATEGVNNLFVAMRNNARPDSASRAVSVVSEISSASTSHKRQRPLEDYVQMPLRDNEVCKKTIATIKTLRNVKKGQLKEAAGLIVHVSPDPVQQPLPPNYPTFDPHSYLFCGQEKSFGYDFQTLRNNQDLVKKSLIHALKPGCKRTEPPNRSLDLVFRRVLRGIAEELHDVDDPASLVVTLENPLFVSGRYLELRLLQKLGEFYRVECGGLDLSKYLTLSSADTTSPLSEYVDGSRCEQYVRILHDRYGLRSATDLMSASPESLVLPSFMRVWTDVETQSSTSLKIYNDIETVFEEASRGGGEINVEFMTKFGQAYGKHMTRFMKEHQQFLARALKASELFVWMCFGIATDEVFQGNAIMANSYVMASAESENPYVCWNYPLAKMIRQQPADTVEPPPLFVYDDEVATEFTNEFMPKRN